jgi:hypothetical protein
MVGFGFHASSTVRGRLLCKRGAISCVHRDRAETPWLTRDRSLHRRVSSVF